MLSTRKHTSLVAGTIRYRRACQDRMISCFNRHRFFKGRSFSFFLPQNDPVLYMAVPIFHVNEGACAAVFACSGEGTKQGSTLPLRSLPEYPDYLHIFSNKPFFVGRGRISRNAGIWMLLKAEGMRPFYIKACGILRWRLTHFFHNRLDWKAAGLPGVVCKTGWHNMDIAGCPVSFFNDERFKGRHWPVGQSSCTLRHDTGSLPIKTPAVVGGLGMASIGNVIHAGAPLSLFNDISFISDTKYRVISLPVETHRLFQRRRIWMDPYTFLEYHFFIPIKCGAVFSNSFLFFFIIESSQWVSRIGPALYFQQQLFHNQSRCLATDALRGECA